MSEETNDIKEKTFYTRYMNVDNYLDFSALCEDNYQGRNDSSYNWVDGKDCKGCYLCCSICEKCRKCGCSKCSDYSITSMDIDKKDSEDKSLGRSIDIPKNVFSASCSSGKTKKYVISFGSKVGHPWNEYNPDNESIYVNGRNGPILHLYRGCTYYFCVEQNKNHELILTDSPRGGPGSKLIAGTFRPLSKGCAYFKVNKYTPRFFYYQDSKGTFQGGLIIVEGR